MGCGKDKDKDMHGKHCVCEVVRAIKDIQDAAEDVCECPSNCFQEPLGSLVSPANKSKADTRVFVLKTADGKPFHAFFKDDDCHCVSIFFRVEDIFDNCCATLRVLRPLKDGRHTVNLAKNCCIDLNAVCEVQGFEATGDCITVDLTNFAAIQCIADVYLGVCNN